MPNRVLRDWTDSELIEQLDVNAERFFTRLIMKVDDYGRYSANPKLLKSHLFPLKSDVRETDITRWLTACKESGLIALYDVARKEYLQIDNFKQTLRQKVEKYPPPPIRTADDKQMISISEADEVLKRNESETETNQKGAKALLVANATQSGNQQALKKQWEELVQTLTGQDVKVVWNGLKQFISDSKPEFIEPYKEAWNLFAGTYKLALVEVLGESRKKKFKTRIGEEGFDFLKILEKIKTSSMLKGLEGSWKVSFDWILENDNNYAKILNGNYD